MEKKKNAGQQWLPEVQKGVEESFGDRPKGMPTLAMIKTITATLGLPDSDAEALYDAWLANGFRTGRGRKIINWQATLRTWNHNRFFPSQKLKRPPVKEAGWEPPTKETFLRYCTEKKMTGTYALRLYRFLMARSWKYYGTPITSEEQWQAICHTHEFNDR
jgi:hypothetical protein